MYQRKSFTVPASAGSAAYCAEHGHTLPDLKGRCLRCGTRTSPTDYIAFIDSRTTPSNALGEPDSDFIVRANHATDAEWDEACRKARYT